MTKRHPLSAVVLLSLAASPMASGCAMSDLPGTPSLERRAIERRETVVAPSPGDSVMPPMVTATVREALSGLLADARRGDAAFHAALNEHRAAVLAGRQAADGTEAWAAAHVALSRIEAARGPTMVAMAELDRLTLDRLEAGAIDDAQLLAQGQSIIAALVSAQQAAMAPLRP